MNLTPSAAPNQGAVDRVRGTTRRDCVCMRERERGITASPAETQGIEPEGTRHGRLKRRR